MRQMHDSGDPHLPTFMPMIIGEVRRYLRDNNTMRVSSSLRDLAYRALRAREELVRRLQRDPTMDEIAAEIDTPREDVVRALEAIQDTVSLYEPVFRDNGDTVFIKKSDTVLNGEIAAIIIGDEATLKRVYYYPESTKLMLISENSSYEPMVYTGEELDRIRIIGKAVAFKSEIR